MSDFGQTFAHWRADAGAHWGAYVDHDFVRGLQDGTLPRAQFLKYLVQDYVFLVHFSRAWALAVVKAGDLTEMKSAAATVDALVNHEMQLHVQTCAAAGVSEADLFAAQEEPENLAYTRYVLEAGYSGDYLDLMAALMPCVLGYGEIGARLGASDPAATYSDWINTYAGAEYQELCQAVGAQLDVSVANRLGDQPQLSPRWAALSQRFRTATRLEVGFWDMGLRP